MKIYVALIASVLATSASAKEVVLHCEGAKANGEAVQYNFRFDEEAGMFNGLSTRKQGAFSASSAFMTGSKMGSALIEIDRATGEFSSRNPALRDIGSGKCAVVETKF